jgi:hypothetical protein
MAIFHFYSDQKCTTLIRISFEVEAESQEEATQKATQKATQMHSSGELSDEPWETLYETKETYVPIRILKYQPINQKQI